MRETHTPFRQPVDIGCGQPRVSVRMYSVGLKLIGDDEQDIRALLVLGKACQIMPAHAEDEDRHDPYSKLLPIAEMVAMWVQFSKHSFGLGGNER